MMLPPPSHSRMPTAIAVIDVVNHPADLSNRISLPVITIGRKLRGWKGLRDAISSRTFIRSVNTATGLMINQVKCNFNILFRYSSFASPSSTLLTLRGIEALAPTTTISGIGSNLTSSEIKTRETSILFSN